MKDLDFQNQNDIREKQNDKNKEIKVALDIENNPDSLPILFKKNIKIEDIISFISFNLSSIIDKNKQIGKKQTGGDKEPLYGRKIPALSIEQYLLRIKKYTKLEENTIILAYHFIEKIIENNFTLGLNNVYRLLLGTCIIAIKFLEDNKYNNSDYCQIGGLSLQEFNKIEYNVLKRLRFNLYTKIEEINKIKEQINIFVSENSSPWSSFKSIDEKTDNIAPSFSCSKEEKSQK